MKKTAVFIIVALLFVSPGCKNKETEKEKIFPVKTVRLARGPIAVFVTVMGSVDSKTHSWVIAPAEGTVSSLAVREGDRIGEGGILFYIMPPDYQSMLGQARIEYQASKHANQAAGESDRDSAAAALSEAEARYNSAKKLFKRVPVVSPVSGTILSKNVENGTNVTLKQPLIEIADLNRLIIKTAVSEDIVSKLRRGQRVKVKLYADTENSIPGVISVITPGVNYQTRTAGIEISVPRSNPLKPGMTCAVEFVTVSRSDAISVPLEAVMTDVKGRKKVFIVKNGKAASAYIDTGIESNTRIEILSGVNVGDEIVVMGQDNLKDGVKVKMSRPAEKEEKAVKAGEKK
jgi:multidrug efflux pump subunit AcrA (membrane-fusion protein)